MQKRETFTSRFGLLMTMIGVAVGLGNIWRFPYMVGKFGGITFVIVYVCFIFLVGIPALMAEWTLGRYTQRGTMGAFDKGGLPWGKVVGGFLFIVVICASGYYTNTIGWVGYYGLCQILKPLLGTFCDPGLILPPAEGFNSLSFFLQMIMTGSVILLIAVVLLRGLRRGIEKASKFIMPTLFVILIILIFRAVTLPGAAAGLSKYIGDFQIKNINSTVMAAALGQAIFSLSLGGTFMVVYGSYLGKRENIPRNSIFTGLWDLLAGILAGLAIFPAVFAFNLRPDSGPALIFQTLPKTFAQMPMGWLFGFLFFIGLWGAAYLSDVAAFEVLVSGITDNTRWTRQKAVLFICIAIFLAAMLPMINLKIFIPWDLIFGSGMQILGSLLAVVTVTWCVKRSRALKEMAEGSGKPFSRILYWWMRLVIPAAILFVGINWLLENIF